MRFMKRAQVVLGKIRVNFDLIHRRNDAGFLDEPFDMRGLKIRHANRFDTALVA